MKFSELVRVLEENGFRIVKEKGSIRYYKKAGWEKLLRVDYHGSKEVPSGTCHGNKKEVRIKTVIDLPYSLTIEATDEPDYFGFYSPDLEGFSGIGHSVEDCLYQAKHGMQEHVKLLREQGLPIPPVNRNPRIVVENEQKQAIA